MIWAPHRLSNERQAILVLLHIIVHKPSPYEHFGKKVLIRPELVQAYAARTPRKVSVPCEGFRFPYCTRPDGASAPSPYTAPSSLFSSGPASKIPSTWCSIPSTASAPLRTSTVRIPTAVAPAR